MAQASSLSTATRIQESQDDSADDEMTRYLDSTMDATSTITTAPTDSGGIGALLAIGGVGLVLYFLVK